MKKIKLFNVFFPLWLIVFFPPIILFTLPINFIIDSIVFLLLLKFYNNDNIKEIYKNNILYVWVLGFAADIVGASLLLSSTIFDNMITSEESYKFVTAIMTNPFSNQRAFIFTLIATLISGLLIYIFNIKFNLKEIKNKKRIALLLAIITAPYFFFFPSELLYNNPDKIYINNLHKYQDTYIGDNSSVANLVHYLSGSYGEVELLTSNRPYTIIITWKDGTIDNLDRILKKDTALLFKLVINADKIIYDVNGDKHEYTFDEINSNYESKLRTLSLNEIINWEE